ncbi:MAG: hypothetical protein A3F70_12275 [Acidobacteria bacterium RIFCSPLOWO2_12_FULL_67_14]|nr:MAG: hypothetical protein A3H29_19580 [Acidobacteria bacterium RIFCSPLOWO2_02_FULL_67_21]OFW34921.1 MAG: hypothetical protein A3F70_12275 [Acidobacteria bacterium RIFCSPLOWO2_12_FULL_67_14]
MTLVCAALRLALGAALAWPVAMAAAAPEVSTICALAAVATLGATVWRPSAGVLAIAAIAPVGALLAPGPVRAAELLAWSLAAGWLLRVWRPLMPPGPRTVTMPAVVFGLALLGSWLALSIAGGAGAAPRALPLLLLHAIPANHLVFTSPEPETRMLLHSLSGLGVLLVSLAAAREDARLSRQVAVVAVGSMTALAAATLASVAAQWAGTGYGGWFLLRYINGERYSLHLADLNAAGSLYVVAVLVAASALWSRPPRRGLWIAALAAVLPALWLTGSRSSLLAMAAGLLILAAARRPGALSRARIVTVAAILSAILLAALALMDWQPDVRGSAARSATLRSQFLATTGRMFASAPIFGVGIGRYFDRSAEFMSPELRGLYGNENAHNYFAQQFAELGLVGGVLFLWLAGALVAAGWERSRAPDASPLAVGLFAGVSSYLMTCVTGHPLLVAEAALPFWAASGALAGAGSTRPLERRVYPLAAALAGLAIAAGVAGGVMAYAAVGEAPAERGFHGIETAPDGAPFRWMTRHAVTYVPNDGPGFLRLRVRAPGIGMLRPLMLETSVAGRVVDRREVPADRWMTFDMPVRSSASAPFRRVDLWANQVWDEEVPLGRRQARRPIAIRVGEIRWIPLGRVP